MPDNDANNQPGADTVTEAANTRKYGSAGWEGMFKISTRLMGEKEIDIDDREANIIFSLEMATVEPWEFKLTNLHVVLKLNPAQPNQNISIEGKTSGEVVIFNRADGLEIFPGAVLNKPLMVRTGAFSAADRTAGRASPGLKKYDVEIEYDLVPIVGNPTSTTNTQLVFYVAND